MVHLAAISNDPVGHLNPRATYSVNADGAVHMAAVAREGAGVRDFSSRLPARCTAQPATRR